MAAAAVAKPAAAAPEAPPAPVMVPGKLHTVPYWATQVSPPPPPPPKPPAPKPEEGPPTSPRLKALGEAIKFGEIKEVTEKLVPGVSLEKIHEYDKSGRQAIHWAADAGRPDVVKLLHEKGADLNSPRKDKWTALFIAGFWGHESTVKQLLELGADPTAYDNDFDTPDVWTEKNHKAACAKLIREAQATPKWSKKMAEVKIVIEKGKKEKAEQRAKENAEREAKEAAEKAKQAAEKAEKDAKEGKDKEPKVQEIKDTPPAAAKPAAPKS
jgi:hypothetical protein